jgi:hypothetical protein
MVRNFLYISTSRKQRLPVPKGSNPWMILKANTKAYNTVAIKCDSVQVDKMVHWKSAALLFQQAIMVMWYGNSKSRDWMSWVSCRNPNADNTKLSKRMSVLSWTSLKWEDFEIWVRHCRNHTCALGVLLGHKNGSVHGPDTSMVEPIGRSGYCSGFASITMVLANSSATDFDCWNYDGDQKLANSKRGWGGLR